MADEKLKEQFYKVLGDIESPDGLFMHTDIESFDFKPGLKYSRTDFISDIIRIISPYDTNVQTDMTGFFGFLIEKNAEGKNTIKGYPSVVNLDRDDIAPDAVKIFDCVKRFTLDNEVVVYNNKAMTKYLNVIVKALPEFLTLIDKVQHKTHSYSVDVHTLKVLQGVIYIYEILKKTVDKPAKGHYNRICNAGQGDAPVSEPAARTRPHGMRAAPPDRQKYSCFAKAESIRLNCCRQFRNKQRAENRTLAQE